MKKNKLAFETGTAYKLWGIEIRLAYLGNTWKKEPYSQQRGIIYNENGDTHLFGISEEGIIFAVEIPDKDISLEEGMVKSRKRMRGLSPLGGISDVNKRKKPERYSKILNLIKNAGVGL